MAESPAIVRTLPTSLGARPCKEGICFSVWAPTARSIDVLLEGSPPFFYPLEKATDGTFHGLVPQARVGSLYRYRIDGQDAYPDPASRYQPQGVHGPSQVVDPKSFVWTDKEWRGIPSLRESILYELHVGTFTPEGTFAALIKRLPYLADLGVTTLELMPVADFPGRFNWGYDGVCLFAPAHTYGTPDDLRRLVNAAHRAGLAVMLDVVYNHLGPDGNYLSRYSPFYFTSRHQTPWGAAVNLDGEYSAEVRNYFIENALHWIQEYHFDGLRLDATHALQDASPRHFLAELTDRVHSTVTDRPVLLIAEDCRNLAHMIKPEKEGGWGLDGVWSDDFHHQVRRSLAGDHESYYRDFSGSLQDLVTTIQKGWYFCGQVSEHFGGPRGTNPGEIPLSRFVFFIQNHDQVGNRAFGERLHHHIDAASYRAAAALLLSVPETPLLFMGQEWAASTPFQYFTDHAGDLGFLVTKGRREEFKEFSVYSDPAVRQRIPDPQNPSTFERSHLNWSDLDSTVHSSMHQLFHALTAWRRKELSPLLMERKDFKIEVLGRGALALEYRQEGAACYRIFIQWQGAERHDIPRRESESLELMLMTESTLFCPDPKRISLSLKGGRILIDFQRPGAVILKARAS